MPDLPTGTVTLLFTDIEGSTRLLDELGDRYAALLAEHRRVLREAFGRIGGIEVDTQGDAFFYAFPKATDAVAAAADAQRSWRTYCGSFAQTASASSEALRIFQKLRDQGSAADCLEGLAHVAAAAGQTERAARLRGRERGVEGGRRDGFGRGRGLRALVRRLTSWRRGSRRAQKRVASVVTSLTSELGLRLNPPCNPPPRERESWSLRAEKSDRTSRRSPSGRSALPSASSAFSSG